MPEDRMDRIERKIDWLTCLAIALITLVIFSAMPDLLGLAIVTCLIACIALGIFTLFRAFMPGLAYRLGSLTRTLGNRRG